MSSTFQKSFFFIFHNIPRSTKLLSCKSSAYPRRCVMVWQVSFTPNGVDMQMLQPCSAPLRRHFLPAVKVEYSVSTRQSSYRVQIHRIQVKDVYELCSIIFERQHESFPPPNYEGTACCIPRLWVFVLSSNRSRTSFLEPSSPMCSTL